MDKRGVCDQPGGFQGPCAQCLLFFLAWQSTPGGEGCGGEELTQSRQVRTLSGLYAISGRP